MYKNDVILGIEPGDVPEEAVLARYPKGSRVLSIGLPGFSLEEIRRNWRIKDGTLIRRPIVSLCVTPEITYPGEPVLIKVRVCHILPEERRSSISLRIDEDVLKVSLFDDKLVPEHLVGEASYAPKAPGIVLIELQGWPEADCVPKPVTVV